MQISKFLVVVGDVMLLSQGDEVVADGILFESSSLKLNESSLTGTCKEMLSFYHVLSSFIHSFCFLGESEDVVKSCDTSPIIFSATQVTKYILH